MNLDVEFFNLPNAFCLFSSGVRSIIFTDARIGPSAFINLIVCV